MGFSDDAEFVGNSSRSGSDVPVSHVTVRRGRPGSPKFFWGVPWYRYTADKPGGRATAPPCC